MNIDQMYKNLTGVNIEEQKRLWDERGKGYYGEYLVFREIYSSIKGCCKILMNLQIPSPTGGTTEIDLVLIHETGLYVFEVKHYKGTIFGKVHEQKWTQYFRTARNNSFRNPVEQNQHHIRALKSRYPYLPVYSFIVFTSSECELRIEGRDEQIDIGKLSGLRYRLEQKMSESKDILPMERIDSLFGELLPFAPQTQREVPYDGEEVPFYKFAEDIKNNFEKGIKNEKKKTVLFAILAAVLCLVVIYISIIICIDYKDSYNAFAQKFEKVEHLNNGDLVVREDLLTITELQLENSSDILNMVECVFWVKVTSEDYGIQVPEDAKFIVMLKNGHVQEYDFWGESHKYSEISSRIGYKTEPVQILPHNFYDVKVEDISYIKLTGLILWRWENKAWAIREDVLSGMELEIYDAENHD